MYCQVSGRDYKRKKYFFNKWFNVQYYINNEHWKDNNSQRLPQPPRDLEKKAWLLPDKILTKKITWQAKKKVIR